MNNMPRNAGGGRPQTVNLPGCPIGVWGIKAEFHVNKHKEKLAKYKVDCGIDLFPSSTDPEVSTLSPNVSRINIFTGVHFIFPPGITGLIFDRSSTPLVLHGATTYGGVIDPLYTGEMKVHVHCHPDDVLAVVSDIRQCAAKGTAVAQVIPIVFNYPSFELLPHLPSYNMRDQRGYGSTDSNIIP